MDKFLNKKLIGIIVGGDDNDPDPQKLGRVKVFCPQLHGKDFDPSKAPWVQTSAPATQDGTNSFNRPPQQGSVVQFTVKSDAGHGYVDSMLHGKHEPKDIPGNFLLNNMEDWFNKARSIKPKFASGDPDFKQTETQNRSGLPKITGDAIPDKEAPSVIEREGTPTDGASPLFTRKYKPITGISTALTNAIENIDPSISSLLSGTPFSIGNLLNMMPNELKKELFKSIPPEVGKALENSLNILGSYTPKSSANFSQSSSMINPASFFTNILPKLKGMKNVSDIENVLSDIISDSSLSGLANISTNIQTPFGSIGVNVSPSGGFEISGLEQVKSLQSAFESFVGGIPSAAESFMKNSKIPTELISRMPLGEQSGLVAALEEKGKDMQDKLNKAAKSFFDEE